MSFDSWAHTIALLRNRSEEEQRRIIRSMTPHDALMFDADFEAWAHHGQLPPPGEGWRVWLMMAGRGFGKTRAGAEWISRLAMRRADLRIALIGASIAETRAIMVEGVSGLLSIARRQRRRINWEPSLNRLHWPNGSQAELFSGDHPDGLRGPEHDFAWEPANSRRGGGGRRRGAAAGIPACLADNRSLLPCGGRPHRGVGGKSAMCGLFHQRRMAFRRPVGGDGGLRPLRRRMGDLSRRRVGDGSSAGVEPDPCWRAGGWKPSTRDRFAVRRSDGR